MKDIKYVLYDIADQKLIDYSLEIFNTPSELFVSYHLPNAHCDCLSSSPFTIDNPSLSFSLPSACLLTTPIIRVSLPIFPCLSGYDIYYWLSFTYNHFLSTSSHLHEMYLFLVVLLGIYLFHEFYWKRRNFPPGISILKPI